MKRNLSPLQPLYLRKEENIYILYYIYIIKRKIYKKKKFSFFRYSPPPCFSVEKNKKFFVRVGSLLQPAIGGGWWYWDAANVPHILCTPQQRPLLTYSMLHFAVFSQYLQKYAKIKRFQPLLQLRYIIYHFSK